MAIAVRIFETEMRNLLTGRDGAVMQHLFKKGLQVETVAKQLCGVRSGRLRSSIKTELVALAGQPLVFIGSDLPYALYHHEGTGVFGPHGQPIVPVSKKILSWKDKGGTQIFAHQVKGSPGTHFLLSALETVRR